MLKEALHEDLSRLIMGTVMRGVLTVSRIFFPSPGSFSALWPPETEKTTQQLRASVLKHNAHLDVQLGVLTIVLNKSFSRPHSKNHLDKSSIYRTTFYQYYVKRS